MTVSQIHEALGSFDIKLKKNTPRDVLDSIEYFGHICIIPGRADARTLGDGALDAARYVGVVRKKKIVDDKSPGTAQEPVVVSGVGMNFWLGDEDDKGSVIESEVNYINENFSVAISGLLPSSVQPGTIGGVSGSYSGFHQWQTPRKAIQYICDTMSKTPEASNLIPDDNSSFEATGGVGGWTVTSNAAKWPSPKWRSSGTYASGTGNITPGLPSGYAADDVFLLVVEFDATDNPTIAPSGGWTQIGTTQRTAASATRSGGAVFWKRAVASETAPTITDTGDHTTAIIHAFTGCKTTGSPVNTSAQTLTDTPDTSVVFPSVTTSVDNCAVVLLSTTGADSITDQYSGWAASGLINLQERSDDAVMDGSGGGIGVATAEKVLAGATGTPTATLLLSGAHTQFTVALEPVTNAASSTYSYLGFKSMELTPGVVGNSKVKTNGNTNNALVTEGDTYVAYYWIMATGSGGVARTTVDYLDNGGTVVASAAPDTFLTLPQLVWTQVSRTITVPTGSSITHADLGVEVQSQAVTDKFYIDKGWIYKLEPAVPVSFRVNNDATLDAGPESTLFVTNPTCVITRREGSQGEDMGRRNLPGTMDLAQDMEDYSTRVVVLAQSDGEAFSVGASDIGTIAPGTNSYKDLFGNPLKMTHMVSESNTTEGNADARAELALRNTMTPHRELTLSTDDYDVDGSFNIGDYIYAYDPDGGLVDTANEVTIRGARLNPIKLQVTESEWPVTDAYSIAYRGHDGTWYDLTDYIDYDQDGPSKVVIGDFQRVLDSGTTTVAQRLGSQTIPDNSTPGVVPWITSQWQTIAYQDSSGYAKSAQTLVWATPLNENDTVITDGAYYEIQFSLNTGHLYSQTWGAVSTVHWNQLAQWQQPIQATVSNWESRTISFDFNSFVLQELACGTAYNVRIRAVDKSNNTGAWSTTEIFTTAEDNIPPSQPAPPEVHSSLIAIQIIHNLGKSSGGEFNLEKDLSHLEVHSSYEPGFTCDSSTKIGVLRADRSLLASQAPAVATFMNDSTVDVYTKVVAVDQSGNKSEPSAAAAATPDLIDDSHISNLTVSKITAGEITANWLLSGSIKTAPNGARIEMDVDGFRSYDSEDNLTVNIASQSGDVDLRGSVSSLNYVQNESGWNIGTAGETQFETINILDEIGARTGRFVNLKKNDVDVPNVDELGFYYKTPKPMVRVYRSGAWQLGDGGSFPAVVNWDVEQHQINYPPIDMWKLAQPSRLVAPVDGMYRVSVNIISQDDNPSSTNNSELYVRINKNAAGDPNSGTSVFVGKSHAMATNVGGFFYPFDSVYGTSTIWMASGDYVEVFAGVNLVGGTLDLWVGSNEKNFFELEYVGNPAQGRIVNGPTIGQALYFDSYDVRSFNGSNNLYSSTYGYYGSLRDGNGLYHAEFHFDYPAIQAALSGKSVTSCKLKYRHAGNTIGVQAVSFGTHNVTAARSNWSFTNTTPDRVTGTQGANGSTMVSDLGLPIGLELQSGTSKGLVLGPVSGTPYDDINYPVNSGWIYGTGSDKPQLQIYYV